MALNLPDIYTGTAFNAEPFDPSGVPIWIDLSSRYYGTGSASRGRSQYELGQGQTAQADVTWHDADEALNPANAASAYAPNVVPYRPLLWRVMWPAGGTGNILTGAGFDGSMESYSVPNAPVPPFVIMLNRFGATPAAGLPFIVGAGAWQGTKALQIVAAGAAATKPVGIQLSLPLIPGRQYTAQAHVNQTSATPFQLAVANQTITVDPFNRTVALNGGWSAPTSPLGYSTASWQHQPSNTGFGVSPGFAFMSQSAVNTRLRAFTSDFSTNHAVQDIDQWCTFTIPVVATGQAIQAGLYARYVDSANNLLGLISFNTDLSVTYVPQKLVAGVTTNIGTAGVAPGPYAAGDSFRMHFEVIGPDIWLKVWKVTTPVPEPAAWGVQGSDNAVVAPGQLAVTSILTTGNTNTLPVVMQFSDYRAIGSIVDTVAGQTSTSGSYQLLTCVFTATQPIQQIQMKMQAAPAGANTILVDGIQVEPGGTANTFTTTGPIIRSPWTRGYVERWPIQWAPDSNGFLGVMNGPVVGPAFQLNGAILHAEYRGSLMAKNPRYYWPLNGTATTTSAFGEQSGNGFTNLYRYDALEGPASFTPGTTNNITGDPSGVGVAIGAGATTPPFTGTILVAGEVGLGQALTGIGGPGLAWGLTVALWLSSAVTTGTVNGSLLLALESGPPDDSTRFKFLMEVLTAGGSQGFTSAYGNNVGGMGTTLPVTTNSGLNGSPHLYVSTLAFASDTMTLTSYYDGAVYGTPSTVTVSTLFGTANPKPLSIIEIGGFVTSAGSSSSIGTGIWGTYEHVAIFDRVLSASELADLVSSGKGYPNENSGTRVARYVALAGYTGGVDIQQGMTTMGTSTLAEGTTALEAIQSTQDTEFGVFYESQEGVAFRGRQARYLAVTSAYTFGENVAGGEYPYTGTPSYDDDATYVFNNATITRTGGAIVTATDITGKSQMRYGSRTFTRTVGGNSDLEAQDAATYVVANGKDARPRVAAVTFDAGATRGVTASPDGTLWPMLLSLEVGTRVTLKRRAKAAAGGTLTMSGDFYIEAITPNSIDEAQGTFLFTLLMSPVPVTAQPWILEDSIYGQLDITTVLGF
jgi:hypothetical protein